MRLAGIRRAHWIWILYCLSGCAGLTYETVWIRAFALSFGNTLLAFSTVISIFLGGLAVGAALGGRFATNRPLLLYGAFELWIASYALAIPGLMRVATQWLTPLYGPAGSPSVALVRAILCTLILLPATVPMGAGLPWLVAAVRNESERGTKLVWIYALNTLGGAAGAILCGLIVLPSFGYWRTLSTASTLDAAVGLFAIWMSRKATAQSAPLTRQAASDKSERTSFSIRTLVVTVFVSGLTAMLYEVAGARIAGLLFGPTAATVTLTLAAVLLGLAAGAALSSAISRPSARWLPASQIATVLVLLGGSLAIANSPVWLSEQIRTVASSAAKMQLLETGLIFLLLFPPLTAAGMALPLTMSHLEKKAANAGPALGALYGINTAGCITGALLTGWLLVPHFGAERTLYLGALANAALAIFLVPRLPWRTAASAIAAATAALLIFPQWDMAAMTAGAYKYAPYYSGSVANGLHEGELEFLSEGAAGTVTVRRIGQSQALAIDGKVDATDAGGDLLTEKLLAHLPLLLIPHPSDVCVIGLASGVTAGSALKYPVERLDVIELSKDVVQASHFFDQMNGKPLDSDRVRLVINDGRNHLAMTSRRYDAILSEPSNPWISGMNALFTRDFFRIARSRLKPGGVLAQWFHLYNMAPNDLRSLLRAFTDVFPSATLWQLNEGDVLLTGITAESDSPRGTIPAAALADLAQVGVSDLDLLSTLYIMRGEDLARFAANARPNTDDWPVLEFHGLRNLDLQTSESNARDLDNFPRHIPPPLQVTALRKDPSAQRLTARAKMFEKAESFGLAFRSYQQALSERPHDPDLLAGMLRCARTDEETAAAGTLATRTNEALKDAADGNTAAAEFLLLAVKHAWPERPEAQLNYGLFCFENNRYEDAVVSFQSALKADPRYLPALEAMAKTYLRVGDLPSAALWSRRILDINPNHQAARQALAALEERGVKAPPER